jgi:hypothetical protein
MPKVRQVLGHVCVEVASRERICYRDRRSHTVSKGTVCLVVSEGIAGGKKNYCVDCARAILEQAE